MAESLSGVIDNVIFHNADNGFAVLRVDAKGHRDTVIVVGSLPMAVAGEYVEASGNWVNDREHGRQFKADELRTTPPHTVEGIEKFLGSGLIKGIGSHYAGKIVEVFGERTLQVIDESPAFLKEVKGIGPKRIERIRQSWQEQKAVRNLLVFLQSHGVGTARSLRIYKTYGDQAIDIVGRIPIGWPAISGGSGSRLPMSWGSVWALIGHRRCGPGRRSATFCRNSAMKGTSVILRMASLSGPAN